MIAFVGKFAKLWNGAPALLRHCIQQQFEMYFGRTALAYRSFEQVQLPRSRTGEPIFGHWSYKRIIWYKDYKLIAHGKVRLIQRYRRERMQLLELKENIKAL